MINNIKKISELLVDGENFVICEIVVDGKINYGTINTKHLDSKGKLTKVLNGLELVLEGTIQEAIEGRILNSKIKEMKRNGCSDFEILKFILKGEF